MGREEEEGEGGRESVMPVNRCRFHQHLSLLLCTSSSLRIRPHTENRRHLNSNSCVCVQELLVFECMYKWKGSENEDRKG